MHLVSALSSGILGGEQGHATFKKRGTAANATIYRTFEGTDPDSSGTAVVLGTNGNAEVYVDSLTTVSAYSSSGDFLRSFVAGSSAPNIEVRSSSFDGQDYGDGSGIKAGGASQPTTLQAVLDLWKAINGAANWKVGDNEGNEFSLQDLIIVLLHQSVDVTAPQYGALGDGATDDLAAFVLADAAATAQGGAVILVPASSNFYRWSAKFSLGPKNSILGLGSASSRIVLDGNPAGGMIDVLGASGQDGDSPGKFIRGLTFEGDPQGYIMRVTVALQLEGVRLKDASDESHMQLDVSGVTGVSNGLLHAQDCVFDLGGPTSTVLNNDGVNFVDTKVVFTRCRFNTPDDTYTGDVMGGYHVSLIHCKFGSLGLAGGSQNTGNAFSIFATGANGYLSVTDTEMRLGDTDGQGICSAFDGGFGNVQVRESGNLFEVAERFKGTGLQLAENSTLLSLREQAQESGTNFATGTPAEVDSQNYTQINITRTVSTDFTFDLLSAEGMDGAWLSVTVANFSGGAITAITPGTGTVGAADGLIDNGIKVWLFRAMGTSWYQQATPQEL